MAHVVSTQGARSECTCGLVMDYSTLGYMTDREQRTAAHDAAKAHLRTVMLAQKAGMKV